MIRESADLELVCPACSGVLSSSAPLHCDHCGLSYPEVGEIPVLLPNSSAHVTLWRSQLALLRAQGAQAGDGFRNAAQASGLAQETRERLTRMGEAVRQQVTDIVNIMAPALGGPAVAPSTELPRGAVEYISYLYRDWGWPERPDDENELAASRFSALAGSPLGKTLVLGAGACRLAYDLHRKYRPTQTIAVDIDPYLLVMAREVIRGNPVQLTEASLKVMNASDVARRWDLTTPDAPLGPESMQFLLADGLHPPFPAASFDTIVTPWFIDQVPRDLSAFLQTLRGLLKPGGRWLNQGPLIYPESLPFQLRYSREELFALAQHSGFQIESWSVETSPYLVSPLSGSGKVETVLTFIASSPR